MGLFLSFVVGVAGSLVATLIVVLFASLKSRSFRFGLTAWISRRLGTNVWYVFPNTTEAEEDCKAALKHSRTVRVMVSRGFAINEAEAGKESLFAPIIPAADKRTPYVQLLYPDPDATGDMTNWAERRSVEVGLLDSPRFSRGQLMTQIRDVLKNLPSITLTGKFEVRLYNLPHIGRIILTDEFLFLNPYRADKHGRDCPVIQYGRGEMYDMFSRYFDLVWESSTRILQPSDLPVHMDQARANR